MNWGSVRASLAAGGVALLVVVLYAWLGADVFLAMVSQLGYLVTYGALVVCLVTVILTLVWYPRVRRGFSSPVAHAGLSVVKLLLLTTALIVAVQVGLLLVYADGLYLVSFSLFVVSLVMFTVRSAVTLGGAYLHKRQERRVDAGGLHGAPLVTVVVPAYNEEQAIGKTVDALLSLTYAPTEIIVVDDGSTDRTLEVARRYADGDRVKVVAKANGGKWDALNAGIKAAAGEFIVCIDADTLLDRQAVHRLVQHFADSQVGAVAGNVKVGNRRGVLTKLQALEYVVGINLHRRSEACLEKVTVVPGPIGAFRASVLADIGLFAGDTFAEDADVTVRILKAGYKTVFEPRAFAYTEAPKALASLAKQRYRWYRGSLQVLSKHRDMAFNRRYGRAGTVVMPWTLFNGVVFPWFMFFTLMWLLVFCFNPISPYTVYQPRGLVGPPTWAGGRPPVGAGPGAAPGAGPGSTTLGITLDFFQAIPYIYVFWFVAFAVLEVAIAAYALSLDFHEKRVLLIYAVPYRLVYTYVVDIMRMVSHLEEVFHYPMKWEKIDHQGTAALDNRT